MRIGYIFTRKSDDERAIAKALEELGHQVELVHDAHMIQNAERYHHQFDLILFHHCTYLDQIKRIGLPTVFWCFDLIVHDKYDQNIIKSRQRWARKAVEISDLGFFTDGGAVEMFPENTLRLTQGAQTIRTGTREVQHDILFAGTVEKLRLEFFRELEKRLPERLRQLNKREKIFGPGFAEVLSTAKIILAPNAPISHNYWSNRVYMVTGYGGFLLHPYIEELESQYTDGEEIVYYTDVDDLATKAEYYLDNEEERNFIAARAQWRTEHEHMYSHRVRVLMRHVEERLSMGV